MLDATWRKSARSQDTNCVEVAYANGKVLVRDTKDRDGVILAVAPGGWAAFITAVKNGEFDRG